MTTHKRGRVRTSAEVSEKAIREGRATDAGIDAAHQRLLVAESAYKLRQIREKIGTTQRSLAQTLRVSQPAISKLERGDVEHMQVGTVAGYVAALGGRLRLIADFGDSRVEITGPLYAATPAPLLFANPQIEQAADEDATRVAGRPDVPGR